jgi:cyclopropane-fatty-acyl-phospholipid synthase
MEKALFNRVLKLIKVGGIHVQYWDGTEFTFGAEQAWFTLRINHPRAIRAMARNMTVGFGEAYMKGEIEVIGNLAEVGHLVGENQKAFNKLAVLDKISFKRLKRNNKHNQRKHIAHHYDLGNDFYKLWLDSSMAYSCAYFKNPTDSLETAQIQKIDQLLKKLQLKPGMTLLDIGSGWGELLIRAVQDYGVIAHGITLSEEQYQYCTKRVKDLGLSGNLTFELINYQDLAKKAKQFDRIISVGMYEHVGEHNQKDYFRAVHTLLKDGGISVLHSITNQKPAKSDPWIDKYIFPGGYLPAVETIAHIWPQYGFQLLDYENLRLHYAMTLREWTKRFEANETTIIKMYGDEFYRMWKLYLAGSESGFRWGDLGLSQFVFSKGVNNDLPLTRDHLYR